MINTMTDIYTDSIYRKIIRSSQIAHIVNDNLSRWAAQKGHLCLIKNLREKGSLSNTTEALELATQNGHLDIVKYLIEICKNNKQNEKILAMASKYGHLNIVKYMIEDQNVDVHTENEEALISTLQNNCLTVFKYLVEEQSADVHVRNDLAYKSFKANKNLEGIAYLIDHCRVDDMAIKQGYVFKINLNNR